MVWLSKVEAEKLPKNWRRKLTVVPRAFDAEAPQEIECFVEDIEGKAGMVGLPLATGLPLAERMGLDLKFAHVCNSGKARTNPERLPDPHHPKAPEGQADFFEDVLSHLRAEFATLACAQTGTGKTVAALNAAGTLRQRCAVVVPSGYVMQQWVDEAALHLGIQAGRIGDGFHEPDADIVVCTVQTLISRALPRSFFKRFGMVVFDEVHRLGAPQFSRVLPMFPARYRLGLTATPERKDGCSEVFMHHLGPVAVNASSMPLDMAVHCLKQPHGYVPEYLAKCKRDALALRYLSTHKARNAMLAKAIGTLYTSGRNVVAFGRFVWHLEDMQARLAAMGVPSVLFTGSKTGPEGKRVKVKRAELQAIKVDSSGAVILTLYQMMREAVDIPRLDAGVELLPCADAVQAAGRIRRYHAEKGEPVWVAVHDAPQGITATLGLDIIVGYHRAKMRGLLRVPGITFGGKVTV